MTTNPLSVRDIADLMPHILAQCYVDAPASMFEPSEEYALRGDQCTCLTLREEIAEALTLRLTMEPKVGVSSGVAPKAITTGKGLPLRDPGPVVIAPKSRRTGVKTTASSRPAE